MSWYNPNYAQKALFQLLAKYPDVQLTYVSHGQRNRSCRALWGGIYVDGPHEYRTSLFPLQKRFADEGPYIVSGLSIYLKRMDSEVSLGGDAVVPEDGMPFQLNLGDQGGVPQFQKVAFMLGAAITRVTELPSKAEEHALTMGREADKAFEKRANELLAMFVPIPLEDVNSKNLHRLVAHQCFSMGQGAQKLPLCF